MILGAAHPPSRARITRGFRLLPAITLLAAVVLAITATWASASGAQVTPIDDEPGIEAPGLGNIVGSPEAGPEPEDAGDRGGWAQLTLAVVLFGGVVFIGSRILKESRAGRASNTSDASGPPNAPENRAL